MGEPVDLGMPVHHIENAWKAQGACAGLDPELFYPKRGEDTATAKAICRGCDVREACLEYALATIEMHGIWGAKSERERRAIRRQRREAGAPPPGRPTMRWVRSGVVMTG